MDVQPSFMQRLRKRAPNVTAVLGSRPWWRHQTWVAATEILAGFFVALGLLSGLSAGIMAGAMALVYGTNSLAVWTCRTFLWGRMAWGVVAWGALVASLHFSSLHPWSMAICIGALLSFRDQYTVHSLATMAVRTQRKGGNRMHSLAWGAIFGALFLALALFLSGLAMQALKWWPHLVAFVACLAILPEMLSKRSPSHKMPPAQPQQMDWVLKVSLTFNAVNFLGRRIVLPGAFIALSSYYGEAKDALPMLGAMLGLMGALGTLVRLPGNALQQLSSRTLLLWGARASLLGWTLLVMGVTAWKIQPSAWTLGPTILGWAMLEFANRSWSISFMDYLHATAIGQQRSDARTHRWALQRFMIRKSFGGAAGCALAAALPPIAVPGVALLLIGTCWSVLRKADTLEEPSAASER